MHNTQKNLVQIKEKIQLKKNESIDKKLLRYLTVRVKKFNLESNFFSKKDDSEKKENNNK